MILVNSCILRLLCLFSPRLLQPGGSESYMKFLSIKLRGSIDLCLARMNWNILLVASRKSENLRLKNGHFMVWLHWVYQDSIPASMSEAVRCRRLCKLCAGEIIFWSRKALRYSNRRRRHNIYTALCISLQEEDRSTSMTLKLVVAEVFQCILVLRLHTIIYTYLLLVVRLSIFLY